MSKNLLKLSNLKVGLTVFIGLVILFIFLFIVGSENNFLTSKYQLKIFVDNVQGLNSGSMVSLGGIKIGSVKDIEFARKDSINGVDVTLDILTQYQPEVTKNSTAQVKTIGLLGDQFVDISIGQKGEVPLQQGDYITVKPTLTFDKFADKIDPVVDDFSGVMKNLKVISDSIAHGKGMVGRMINNPATGKNLEQLIANINSVTGAITQKKGTLGKLVYDTSLYNNLKELTGNINSISDSVQSGKGTLGKLLVSDSLYNNINTLTVKLNNLISKTESDSTMVGGLFNDTKFYNQFNSVLKELNLLIKDLREHPEDYVQFSVF
ncbi:MAG TPA: MlaD family protein [Ignavibacteriaceae bacterium]|nr:MlaD family protein [Ignavibacteriaceae bacterium]